MTKTKIERKGISKKMRFEVLKRDSFTCQYCGEKAPNVLLQIDHIKPVSKGGTNDLMNLITACNDCNAGKSNRELSDKSTIEKKRKQLDELQERKEQLEMLIEWQEQLSELDKDLNKRVSKFWSKLVKPYTLTEAGEKDLEKLIHKFGESKVMEAMRIAVRQYIEYVDDQIDKDSVDKAWSKIGGICRVRKSEEEKPYLSKLFYVKGILKNRLSYVNERLAIDLLEECVELGIDIDWLEGHAKRCNTWTQWREDIEELIDKEIASKK